MKPVFFTVVGLVVGTVATYLTMMSNPSRELQEFRNWKIRHEWLKEKENERQEWESRVSSEVRVRRVMKEGKFATQLYHYWKEAGVDGCRLTGTDNDVVRTKDGRLYWSYGIPVDFSVLVEGKWVMVNALLSYEEWDIIRELVSEIKQGLIRLSHLEDMKKIEGALKKPKAGTD